ncbi:isocitrate/isopropylmalate dehydrogenase family protein [Methanolapillus millepedarum]|uniref:3-isopropylmalate dehydrogenase n=1 Tax=Methanolapillus millepedarum TaxID=3028296 RepID=A0AA96V3K7_9EURY|nr:Homoisocitrate dehydrogenase [Methanosarcinaceae archaeon Ac7]
MRIAIVEGDGIGKEVIPEAVSILDYFNEKRGLGFEKVPVEVGLGKWEKTGEAISDADIALLNSCDAVLFGAITTVSAPSYKSVVLRIRKELDFFANVRPIHPIPGIEKCLDYGFLKPDTDIVIVRENTEGLYSGIEELGDERSTTLRVITKKASERIAAFASELASSRKNKLTIVHKSNVIKSDKLFLDTCKKTALDYFVEPNDLLVDAFSYDMLIHPEKYDVVVTTNLFGDILSDTGAVLLGSIGLAPSANIGDKKALFEPVHGSAPDIAGKGIANPMAAILSLKMMFEWLKMNKEAELIEKAVSISVSEKKVTPDLGGNLSTREVGKFILEQVKILDSKADKKS